MNISSLSPVGMLLISLILCNCGGEAGVFYDQNLDRHIFEEGNDSFCGVYKLDDTSRAILKSMGYRSNDYSVSIYHDGTILHKQRPNRIDANDDESDDGSTTDLKGTWAVKKSVASPDTLTFTQRFRVSEINEDGSINRINSDVYASIIYKNKNGFYIRPHMTNSDRQLILIHTTEELEPYGPDWISTGTESSMLLFVFKGTEESFDNNEFKRIKEALSKNNIQVYFKRVVDVELSDCYLERVEDRARAIEISREISPKPTWAKYCTWNRGEP